MKKIKSITINGRQVSRVDLGGGIMWCKSKDYRFEEVKCITSVAGGCMIIVPSPIGLLPRLKFFGLRVRVNDVSLFHLTNTGSPKSGIWGCNPDRWFFYKYGNGGWTHQSVSFNLNQEYDMEFGNTIVMYGVVMATVPDVDFTSVQNIPLRIYGDGYGDSNGITMSRVELWDGNTMLRDMVCVREIATGEVGLYDRISKEFYRNLKGTMGTGDPTGNHY